RIQCPVCNLIAENLMKELLENNNTLFECHFSTEGCKEKKGSRRIGEHEASCWYRCVDPCKWKGPIKNLVKHFAATRCAQVLKTSAQTSPFSSSICDFPLKNSVFKRSTKTHWKPVLLFSPLNVAFFINLNISRDENGIWSLSAKAYAPPSIMESLSVELCAHSPSTEFPRRAFTYFGKIQPSSATDKEIIASGEHLLLADAQVKSLIKDSF
ncbi:E3 ubiquitin-protein ligase, partial [Caligus rogercresseyi]